MSAMTPGSVLRAVRTAVFAVVCVTTAALGHALMSARPLPWWALGAAFGVTGAVAWWLAGRERGAPAVIGATVVAQLGLHSLFGLAQASTPTVMRGVHGAAHMADMAHLSAVSSGLGPGAGMGIGQMELARSGHGSLGMFLAHAVAALVCGVWLWRGETAACRLARSVAAVLFAPLLLVLTALVLTGRTLPARPVADGGRPVRLRGVRLQYTVSRRGPPAPSPCC